MARNQYQSDVRTTLQQMLSREDIRSSVGVAKFTTRNKKVYAKIYLKFGKIYSVYSTESTPDYITRFYQSGDLSEINLKIVGKRFGENLNHPAVSEFLIDRHMVSEEAMDNVTQDFFLSICEDVMRWKEVNVDWITNETTDVLKIPAQEVSKVLELLHKRESYVQSIATDLNINKDDLLRLTFVLNRKIPFDADTPLIFHQMVSCATGGTPIFEAAQQFGLTNFRSLKTVYELWESHILTLIHQNTRLPEKQEAVYVEPEISTDVAVDESTRNAVKADITSDGRIRTPDKLVIRMPEPITLDESSVSVKSKVRLILPLTNIIDKRVLTQSTETATVLYHEYSRSTVFPSNEPVFVFEDNDDIDEFLESTGDNKADEHEELAPEKNAEIKKTGFVVFDNPIPTYETVKISPPVNVEPEKDSNLDDSDTENMVERQKQANQSSVIHNEIEDTTSEEQNSDEVFLSDNVKEIENLETDILENNEIDDFFDAITSENEDETYVQHLNNNSNDQQNENTEHLSLEMIEESNNTVNTEKDSDETASLDFNVNEESSHDNEIDDELIVESTTAFAAKIVQKDDNEELIAYLENEIRLNDIKIAEVIKDVADDVAIISAATQRKNVNDQLLFKLQTSNNELLARIKTLS